MPLELRIWNLAQLTFKLACRYAAIHDGVAVVATAEWSYDRLVRKGPDVSHSIPDDQMNEG